MISVLDPSPLKLFSCRINTIADTSETGLIHNEGPEHSRRIVTRIIPTSNGLEDWPDQLIQVACHLRVDVREVKLK